MWSRQISPLLVLALAGGFMGCASTPPTVMPLASSANPITEIERTQEMINEARNQQVDVLSPTNFNKADDALKKAISKKDAEKSNADILQQVAYSRGWLREGREKSEISILQIKNIQDARRGALSAKANELFPKDWDRAGKDLESATKAIEKGDLKPADKNGASIVSEYRRLEREAVSKTALGKADDNIKNAEKEHAEKIAPRSYNTATTKYEAAQRIISANPRDTVAIEQAAAEATRESLHLASVTNKVKAGNTEDLVLQSEHQQRAITNLRQENVSAEVQMTELEKKQQELERNQTLINQAAAIRSQLKPNEAEVFTENGRVMVRLKALQFPANQATLGPRNQAMMRKVNEALEQIGPAKLIVEGHTDSSGNANKNLNLSEQRAKTVQDYLVANGAVTLDNVAAVGKGSEKPISNNKTAAGRAQNRRIDIIVEPLISK